MLTGKVVIKPKAYVADAMADKNDVDDRIGDTSRYRIISRGHDDGAPFLLASLQNWNRDAFNRQLRNVAHVDLIRPRLSLEMAFPLEERRYLSIGRPKRSVTEVGSTKFPMIGHQRSHGCRKLPNADDVSSIFASVDA